MERRRPRSVPEAPPAHTLFLFSAHTTTGSVPPLPCPKTPKISWRAAPQGKCHLQLSPSSTLCIGPSATGTTSVQPTTKCDPSDRDVLKLVYF